MDFKTLKIELKDKAAVLRQFRVELSQPHDSKSCFKQCKRHLLRRDVRHKHIAYCMLRGTLYEAIEKPREDNKPDMQLVQTIIKEVKDACTKEDVCACAQ